ncbi:MAG: hypothetical protein Q8Q92_03710 [bacterium]|nr:hypothetical protein [bacterium]
MASKKGQENFDQMKMSADSLMDKLKTEGEETSTASKGFRSIVMKTLGLHMRMLVWLYQYVRAMQAEQKQMDEDASFEMMRDTLDAALNCGTKMLPMDTGTGAREVTTPAQASATLPGRQNGATDHAQTPIGAAVSSK